MLMRWPEKEGFWLNRVNMFLGIKEFSIVVSVFIVPEKI